MFETSRTHPNQPHPAVQQTGNHNIHQGVGIMRNFKILLLSLFLVFPHVLAAEEAAPHWTLNAGNLYNTNPGSVVIGAAPPYPVESQFHVLGDFSLDQGDFLVDNGYSIEFKNGQGGKDGVRIVRAFGGALRFKYAQDVIFDALWDNRFKINDSASVPVFVIDPSGGGRSYVNTDGNFGIGTDNPQAELDVHGSVTIDGVIVHSSDRRLKSEIRRIPNALEKLEQLHGYSFKWNERPEDGTQLGMMAQEVELQFPELVVDDESGLKAVNYSGLVAPLIEAVKELNSQNEQLRAVVCLDHPSAGLCR